MPNSDKKKKLRKCLTILFYVLMVIFIVLYLKGIDFKIIAQAKIVWPIVILSFTVRMCGLLISPFSWDRLLKAYHSNALDIKKVYRVYAESWMGRYIPGKVAWVGGKILFATQEGVKTDVAVITSFLDSILQIFSSMLVAAIFFLFSNNVILIDNSIIFMIYIATAAMLICLIPMIFNRIVSLTYRFIKKQSFPKGYAIHGKSLMLSTGIVCVAKCFSSCAVAILACAVLGGIEAGVFFYVMAVNLVSTAIGMAAFFAPAGLGVKESMQIILLSNLLGKEATVIIVTLASLQSIVGDITMFLATRLLKKGN